MLQSFWPCGPRARCIPSRWHTRAHLASMRHPRLILALGAPRPQRVGAAGVGPARGVCCDGRPSRTWMSRTEMKSPAYRARSAQPVNAGGHTRDTVVGEADSRGASHRRRARTQSSRPFTAREARTGGVGGVPHSERRANSGKTAEGGRTRGGVCECGGATALPPQTGALRGEQGPQADGGTAWRSAAAHRHHTRLRIPKQVRKLRTGA